MITNWGAEALVAALQALQQDSSSTASTTSELQDPEAGQDLDANFEVLSKGLQKRMVAIAAQSVSEESKLKTQHRWKVMKGEAEARRRGKVTNRASSPANARGAWLIARGGALRAGRPLVHYDDDDDAEALPQEHGVPVGG